MKQSILARLAQLAKANLKALLGSAEDPQKMLDQMVRDGEQWGRRQVRCPRLGGPRPADDRRIHRKGSGARPGSHSPVIDKLRGSSGVTLSPWNECCWIR